MQHGQVLLAANRLSNHSFNSIHGALYCYYFLLCSVEDKSQKGHEVSFLGHFRSRFFIKECGTPSYRILHRTEFAQASSQIDARSCIGF